MLELGDGAPRDPSTDWRDDRAYGSGQVIGCARARGRPLSAARRHKCLSEEEFAADLGRAL
jgi:hypothetical protein